MPSECATVGVNAGDEVNNNDDDEDGFSLVSDEVKRNDEVEGDLDETLPMNVVDMVTELEVSLVVKVEVTACENVLTDVGTSTKDDKGIFDVDAASSEELISLWTDENDDAKDEVGDGDSDDPVFDTTPLVTVVKTDCCINDEIEVIVVLLETTNPDDADILCDAVEDKVLTEVLLAIVLSWDKVSKIEDGNLVASTKLEFPTSEVRTTLIDVLVGKIGVEVNRIDDEVTFSVQFRPVKSGGQTQV